MKHSNDCTNNVPELMYLMKINVDKLKEIKILMVINVPNSQKS